MNDPRIPRLQSWVVQEIEIERVAGRRVDVRYYKNGNCIRRYPSVSLSVADAHLKNLVEQYEELGKPKRRVG